MRRDGGGTEDVQDDLVFVCELEFGREIVEGFFFLLSMDVGGGSEAQGQGTGLTLSASSLSSMPRRRVFSLEKVLMRCWSSAGGEIRVGSSQITRTHPK